MTKAKKDSIIPQLELSEADYIHNRINDQISWYEGKSASFQKRYKFGNLAIIIISASIPLLALWSSCCARIFSALFGSLIVILTSYLSLIKAHELWLTYREAAETLKTEKNLYLTQTTPYDIHKKSDRFHYLVERIESILSTENTNWKIINKKHKE